MATNESIEDLEDVRRGLVMVLMEKVQSDPYPSVTMLNYIESLLEPDEEPAYLAHLLQRVRGDQFPSIDMIKRIQKFV